MDALKAKNKAVNLIVLFAGVIVALQLYKGNLKKMEALRLEQENEKKKNELLAQISGLEAKLDTFKNTLARKDVNTVMNAITMLAQETGLKIMSFRPSIDQPYDEYVKSPYSLEVSAPDYHALGRFVSRVESSQDLYVVDRMSIRPSTMDSKELVADVVLATVALAEK
jgi:Tfp pilus assembly protein PilO